MEKIEKTPPSKSPNKQLRVKAWFNYVAARLHLKRTGYALENYLDPNKVHKNDEGTLNRPRKYDGYQNGLHMPRPNLIDQTDIFAPGSKSLIYHPFWDVAIPIDNIANLYINLNRLSPDVVDLLFYPGTRPGKVPIRHNQDYTKTLDILSKRADLDAFTALIGLIQEDILANITTSPKLHFLYIKPTLTAFRRLIFYPPFPNIANELFQYLIATIFTKLNNKEVNRLISEMNINESVFYSSSLLSIVDDLDILRKFPFPPVSCMHIIEQYMVGMPYAMAISTESEKDWPTFKKLPEIRNLTKALRRWESKQTNFSPIPWS